MNPTKIISVDDPFRAAYLLRFGQYKETRLENGQRCFLIEGEAQILNEETVRFRTGSARIEPLVFRESLYLLKELVAQEFDIDLLDDEIEIEEMTEPIITDGDEKEDA